jgi:hypothetical protein
MAFAPKPDRKGRVGLSASDFEKARRIGGLFCFSAAPAHGMTRGLSQFAPESQR